jgi:formylglycine-generating enzyme required for sulfatase activity
VREEETERRRMPGWARALIGIAVVVILLGVAAYFAYLYGLLPPFLEPYARMILPPTTISYEEYTGGSAASGEATPTPEPTPTPTPTLIPNPTMPAEALTPPRDAALSDVWVRPTDAMPMVFVPAGEFRMGSELGGSDERPQHAVALTEFWIDQTEVTNTQYRWCVESGECRAPTTCDFGAAPFEDVLRGDHPVVCVDWEGAQAYCAWAGGRLPTEAEWEYAARGPESSVYPWGDLEPTCALARYASCEEGTMETGEIEDNASWVGAHDMAGNAWEWVADWYDRTYYSESPGQDPTGPESGSDRVLRGGGWYFDTRYMRAAGRYKLPPGQRLDYVGFRCVYVP